MSQLRITQFIGEAIPQNPLEKLGLIEASVHTPVYTMHKFWARRPWKVFRRLIEVFTELGQIILDPFAGGGVVLVEGLILRRKVVAIDLNPLACFIMQCEVTPLNVQEYIKAVKSLRESLEPIALQLYGIKCLRCGSTTMVDWVERDSSSDVALAAYVKCDCGFSAEVSEGLEDFDRDPPIKPLEHPMHKIEWGEKTKDLIKRGYRFFYQLFTPRNLVMLSHLRAAIQRCPDPSIRDFLLLAFSSTLKWASKMSHRRGRVVEGWALHAYWIYPKYLEINVWKQFLRRVQAVIRGKEYSNREIGPYAKQAKDFNELLSGDATFMVIQGDSRRIPIPDSSVDAVITDPPYGGNVNYAELSDYFLVWLNSYAPKVEEVIINEARGLTLKNYIDGLTQVFRECYRVLKPEGNLLSTFNSTDPVIVGAFIYSLRSAGFNMVGISYQPYLRAYETTFHAMQIDAMPFDFVFWFKKDCMENSPTMSFSELKSFLKSKIEECVEKRMPLREYLTSTYPVLIKFMATASLSDVMSAASLHRRLLEEHREEFSKIRKEITLKRVQEYVKNNNRSDIK